MNTGRDVQLDPLREIYRRLETVFAGGRFHHAEVPGEMQLDWDELRGLTLSLSHTPLPSSAAFPAFEAELRSHFERYEHNGQMAMSTRTWVNAGQFAD